MFPIRQIFSTNLDHRFGLLISGAADNLGMVKDYAQRLDSEDYPQAIRNIGNVVLAEAAKRHLDFELAANRLSLVANPCLHTLAAKCMPRM